MKYQYLILTIVLAFLFAPQSSFAYEVKVAPDISISENYISDTNLYLASLHTWFNATYEKDVVSVSFDQIIGGTIFGDVTLLGKNIALTGESFDDVRTVADTVTVSGVINKDLIIIARNVVIEPGAIINGDTLILAHTVDAQGQFLGQSQITASRISIAGSIVGPTTLTGSKITFTSSSKVLSDLSYFSPQRATIEPNAEIQKQLNFNQVESIKQNEVVKRLFFGFVSFWAIIKLIATLFVIFVLTHLFRVFVQRIIDAVRNKKIETFGIGVASVIGIPLLIVILFGSLVLIPVSIIVGCIFLIMLILLPAMSAIIGASFYQMYIQKQNKLTADFNVSALMLVLLTFVGFIPYVGSLIVYALYFIALGAMVRYLYEQVRRKNVKL
jgi:hypothetical protein